MKKSGGDESFVGDEISLLVEELIQLSVKSSKVVPSEKPTLICTIWTKKSYNPDSFRAQMKSIWKTKKKFEIQLAGQNLYLLVFDSGEDLETVMETQCSYTDGIEKIFKPIFEEKGNSDTDQNSQDGAQFTGKLTAMMMQEGAIVRKENENGEINNHEGRSKPIRKPIWKRLETKRDMESGNGESKLRKRKSEDIEIEDDRNRNSCEVEAKE
ncbi:hypothetical protein PVK06_034459 [Gossypium arboreum]|uniref:DUF4283 domain-containing protein n=1 Tax=Gossypium arboreum TaxID=29729 RepID=A0ABR0NE91_GOSAR|nr:hypothetical protein PVK06_034459 [Gossypium arboreum]